MKSNRKRMNVQPRQVTPARMEELVSELQLEIARRAYHFYECRRRQAGAADEDWQRAENELAASPVADWLDGEDAICARVFAYEFAANELEYAVEPHRIRVCGKRASAPQWLLCTIDSPEAFVPAEVTAHFSECCLELRLPKIAIA
ncbi:MAG: hypothetical protein ACREEM_35360 [Blastocatellia bacterium]